MGLCNSKPSYIEAALGGEREYHDRFLESKTLGQGEFGVVKMVHDVKCTDMVGAKPLAVKYLRKGFTFKDNTLYTPLKKEVLQGEVEILRRLNGECYNLKLVAVYEAPSMIYMVTEFCEGGEMMPWVSKAFKDTSGLRTEDVSRICYQLWSAVDHCAKHKVIHRDIKPENVMFCTSDKSSQLRLIDFGSGTLDGPDSPQDSDSANPNNGESDVERHHTFAGSAFYISPEMFQRTYTAKTDVWSAGATLYVLVAGYPADRLQETFNVLQSTKQGRLRKLPNLPPNMPESFYDMLEGSLAYRHKGRMDAGQLMKCEFSQFHKELEQGEPGALSIQDIAAEAAGEFADGVPEMANNSGSLRRTTSVLLEGSVSRHNAYLGYQKFERSVTTILATMLSKETSMKLLLLLKEQHQKVAEMKSVESGFSLCSSTEKKEEGEEEQANEANAMKGKPTSRNANAEKLQVVTINVLLDVLGSMEVANKKEVNDVVAMIRALNNFALYETFAYHISLLRQFVLIHTQNTGDRRRSEGIDESATSVHGNNVWNALRKKRGLDASDRKGDPDLSTKSTMSAKSTGGLRRVNTATGKLTNHAALKHQFSMPVGGA